MGLPLGPTFANAFLCHHEVTWLNDCPQEFKPIYYRRYIDDCFLIFRRKEHSTLFLNYMNSRHTNMKFTLETETNKSIPFLDVRVNKNGNTFSTSVYRKPTSTGLGFNFLSFTDKIFKMNSIKTLLNRAYNICSTYTNLDKEIKYLRTYFVNNRFPLALFETILHNFLNSRLIPTERQITVPKLVKYVKLPYYGQQSFQFRKEIKSLLRDKFPYINFKIVLSNPFRIKSFFSHKDRIPDKIRSKIVYNYYCSSCNARYIGSTDRLYYSRIREHQGHSIHTDLPLASPSYSSIRNHAEQQDHPVLASQFSILDSAMDLETLRIKEAIYIKEHNPILSKDKMPKQLFTL